MNALDILCAQLMRDLFVKAKFLLLQNMKNNQTTCKTIFSHFLMTTLLNVTVNIQRM